MIQNLTGQKIGNYDLRDRLGRGGMAEVYRAWQPSMERFVAIKVMLSHLSEDEQFIERFRREAKAVGSLRHQHIVQVFDFGHDEERGIYYMVMEHITGGNLKALITREGKMSPDHTLKVGSQLADALHYAHQRSMIHRDLKPANVMFGDDEHQQSILTDFGIARILTETGLTQSGMAVGTPAYMSPEAALGQDIDERADIYALGVMLYEMLTGNVPYSADTPLAVIMKHVNAPLPTRDDFGEMIPQHVEGVILKAMAKEPADRYDTAGDMRDALDEALSEYTSKAPTRRSVKTPPTPSAQSGKTGAAPAAKPAGAAVPNPVSATGGATATQPTIINQNTGVPWWVFVAVLFLIALVVGGFFVLEELDGDESGDSAAALPTQFVPPTAAPAVVSVPAGNDNAPVGEDNEPVAEVAAAPIEIVPREAGFFAQPYVQEVVEINVPDEIFDRYEILSPALESAIPHPENIEPSIGITRLLTERIYPALLDGEDSEVLYGFIDEDLERMGEDDYEVRLSQAMLDVEFDPANAEALARELIEQEPDDWRGYVALSDALMTDALYNPEEAAGAMVAADDLVGRGEPQVAWRIAERVITDPDEAFDLFLEAEDNMAGGYQFIHFAGRILYENSDYPRAMPYMVIEVIDVAGNRETSSNAVDVAHRAMVSLFAMGVGDEFLDPVVEDIIEQELNSDQIVDVAYVALQIGRFDLAEDAIEVAYRLDGENPGAFWLEGLLMASDVVGEVDPETLTDGIQVYSGDQDLNEAITLLENARGRIEGGTPVESDLLTIEFDRHINTDLAQVYLAAGTRSDVPFVMRSLLDPLVFEARVQWLRPYLLKAQVQFTNREYGIICEDTLSTALRIATETFYLTAIGEAREEACTLAETVGSSSPGDGPPGGDGPPNGGRGGDGPPDGAPPPRPGGGG
ncbi:MAG: protein kinase [Chloroflexota bacterium]